MTVNRVDQLRSFVRRSRTVHSILFGVSAGLPLADYVVKVGPPWPSNAPLWTSLVQGGVLLFVFLGPTPESWEVLSARIRRFLVATAVLAMAYVALSSWLVFRIPDGSRPDRDVRGLVVRSEVAALLNDRFTEDDALRGAEYRSESVYRPWSVHVARVSLLTAWMSAFGCFVSCIAAVGKSTRSG